MRVWIISDRRHGDSNEEHWIAEICHDPRPDADPDESVWDRVEYRGRRCATEAEALALVQKLKSNVSNAGAVYKRVLEQIDDDRFDWIMAGRSEEVECIYEPCAVAK